MGKDPFPHFGTTQNRLPEQSEGSPHPQVLKKAHTQNQGEARFTPEQEASSSATQISIQFDPGFTPKYRLAPFREKPQSHPPLQSGSTEPKSPQNNRRFSPPLRSRPAIDNPETAPRSKTGELSRLSGSTPSPPQIP